MIHNLRPVGIYYVGGANLCISLMYPSFPILSCPVLSCRVLSYPIFYLSPYVCIFRLSI